MIRNLSIVFICMLFVGACGGEDEFDPMASGWAGKGEAVATVVHGMVTCQSIGAVPLNSFMTYRGVVVEDLQIRESGEFFLSVPGKFEPSKLRLAVRSLRVGDRQPTIFDSPKFFESFSIADDYQALPVDALDPPVVDPSEYVRTLFCPIRAAYSCDEMVSYSKAMNATVILRPQELCN